MFIYFVYGSQKAPSRHWFSPTMWVLGTQVIRLGGKHLCLLALICHCLESQETPLANSKNGFCLSPVLSELCSLGELDPGTS